jgi:tetratricopeptide (TPR) repeat protein
MRNGWLVPMLGAVLLTSAGRLAFTQERTAARPKDPLAAAIAAYASGDHDVVKRAFARSLDFQAAQLLNPRRLDRSLGAWKRVNATFLLELAAHSADVAPAYTVRLLSAGRRYLDRRTRGASSADDAFERIWHQAAVGILQRRFLVSSVEDYIVLVEKSPAAADERLRARLQFARAVLQEQRCWLGRPVLVRVGTPVAELNRVSGGRSAGPPRRRPGELSPDVSRRLDCLDDAAEQFTAAATAGDTAAEARVRLAWVEFQLGLLPEALAALDGVDPGPEPALRYWATLFRARILAAQQRHADAERVYRAALEICPGAQSAGVGLALTLHAMDRIDDANAAARAVRSADPGVVDPWWTYLSGDSRFVDGWVRQLRGQQ